MNSVVMAGPGAAIQHHIATFWPLFSWMAAPDAAMTAADVSA
jgi:hypothetical protein